MAHPRQCSGKVRVLPAVYARKRGKEREKEVEETGKEKEVEKPGMKSPKMKLLIMRSECRQMSKKLSDALDNIEGVKGVLNIHDDEYGDLSAAAHAVTDVWAWLVECGMKGENDD